MVLTIALLGVVIAITTVLFYFLNDRNSYWKKRGIPHEKPTFFFGNMKGVSKNRHFTDAIQDIYIKYKGSGAFCGIYYFFNPAVLVLDLELAKKIMVKDFNNFADRGVFHNEKKDPLSAHLFAIEGNKWRNLRNKLSPTFSVTKIKSMFPRVMEIGHQFSKAFDAAIGDNDEAIIDVKELNAKYTTDVIGSCAFGIDCNSLVDPKAEFRKYGRKVFEKQRHHPLIILFLKSWPKMALKLGLRITPNDISEFFIGAVNHTIAYRTEHQIKRNDFMDILIDLKNMEPVTTRNGEVSTGLTIEEVYAQAFLFYLAGFETSSLTLSFVFYELARQPEIQDKLRHEINEAFAKNNSEELSYEILNEMTYMNQIIDETLRMYPIITILQRIANKDYDTGDPRYKIEQGTSIIIPVHSIHFDPEIYPNPTKFDPERFTQEEKQKRDSAAWLPFGEGPRNCIGLRFGRMQTKIGMALILKKIKFSISEDTLIPIKFDIRHQNIHTNCAINLKAERVS